MNWLDLAKFFKRFKDIDIIALFRALKAIVQALGWEDDLWDQMDEWAQMSTTPFDDAVVDWLHDRWNAL